MINPFIRNHQYNYIKKHIVSLQQVSRTVADPKVVETVAFSSESKVLELFSNATDIQRQMLEGISSLRIEGDFQKYLRSLEPLLVEFPLVTKEQIRKLFSKNKKLKMPELATIDYRNLTYLSWIDVSTNKLFIVYYIDGIAVGIEGRYSPLNKKSVCSLCNGYGEVALFSALSKSRPAHASPDYYKAIGNYICLNSHECNKNIMDVTLLESFIYDVLR